MNGIALVFSLKITRVKTKIKCKLLVLKHLKKFVLFLYNKSFSDLMEILTNRCITLTQTNQIEYCMWVASTKVIPI